MTTWLSGVGLVCGLVGTVLIFFFGVPRYPRRDEAGYTALALESYDAAEVERVKWASRLGYFGVFLIGVAFALQLAGLLVGD